MINDPSESAPGTTPKNIEKNTKKGGPEQSSKKVTQKVPKMSPFGYQKHGVRTTGVTKIIKCRGPENFAKIAQKWRPKSTTNL